MTLAEFFEQSCKQYASKTAYTYRPTFRRLSWTYQEIWNHATAFAKALEEHGVQAGDRVILVGFNSPFWVAAFFGVHMKGAVAVPLSPESTESFIKEVVRQTEAKLVCKNRFVPTGDIPIPTLVIEDVQKPAQASAIALFPADENALAEIVYTSGTTGNPKGVMLTHKNLLSNVAAARTAIPVDENMHFASILPLFHMFEQIGGLLVPLSAGSQVSYAASLSPNHLRWIFQDDHITRMLVVPEFLRLLYLRIQERAKEEGKLPQLQLLHGIAQHIPSMAARRLMFRKLHRQIGWDMVTLISGGAALDKDAGKFWEGTGIYILQGYGLTETSPVLTANRYEDRNIESVGKPFEGVSLKIAEDGEILAKGPNIFAGYWQQPEQTKEVFDEEGWFRTGDIGAFDEKGRLQIKGRKKFMIVLPSGENVYAEDIESLLNTQAEIKDSTVIGLKTEGGEEVYAVLLLREPKNFDAQAVIDRVNSQLLPYQRIQGFSVWPEVDFPRTPTRKVKKKEVLAAIEAERKGAKKEDFHAASLSQTERIIAQTLEASTKDIQDSTRLVEDLGLDSLQRIELIARIENELGVSLDETEIAPGTTIKDVKNLVAERHQKQVRYPFNPKPFTKAAILFRKIYQPLIIKTIVFIFAPRTVRGKEHLNDLELPALFFSNHLGVADGPVIYASLPARIRAKLAVGAAADRTYDPDAVWWIRRLRVFPELLFSVFPFARENGQTKTSLEYTGRILDRGFSVLLFPEGKMSLDGTFQPLKQGAGLLAIEMGVPVVPIKLHGTQFVTPPEPETKPHKFVWPRRHRVTITFGEPFVIERKMGYREATALIERKMKEL